MTCLLALQSLPEISLATCPMKPSLLELLGSLSSGMRALQEFLRCRNRESNRPSRFQHEGACGVCKCVGPCAGRVALTLAEKHKYSTSKSCNRNVAPVVKLVFYTGCKLGFCVFVPPDGADGARRLEGTVPGWSGGGCSATHCV